jgi:hypothetical protein
MKATEAGMPAAAVQPPAGWPAGSGWVRSALRELAGAQVSLADGYAGRVTDAVLADQSRPVNLAGERALSASRRGAEAVADWARRDRRTVSALASSAILVGALAIGLEARHVRRLRRRSLAGFGGERAA